MRRLWRRFKLALGGVLYKLGEWLRYAGLRLIPPTPAATYYFTWAGYTSEPPTKDFRFKKLGDVLQELDVKDSYAQKADEAMKGWKQRHGDVV